MKDEMYTVYGIRVTNSGSAVRSILVVDHRGLAPAIGEIVAGATRLITFYKPATECWVVRGWMLGEDYTVERPWLDGTLVYRY